MRGGVTGGDGVDPSGRPGLGWVRLALASGEGSGRLDAWGLYLASQWWRRIECSPSCGRALAHALAEMLSSLWWRRSQCSPSCSCPMLRLLLLCHAQSVFGTYTVYKLNTRLSAVHALCAAGRARSIFCWYAPDGPYSASTRLLRGAGAGAEQLSRRRGRPCGTMQDSFSLCETAPVSSL